MRAAGGHYSRAAAAAAAAASREPLGRDRDAAASEQQLRAEAAARREALAAAAAAREAAEAARVQQQLQELRLKRATFRRYMQREPAAPSTAAARLSLRPDVDNTLPSPFPPGDDAACGTGGGGVRVVSGADLARPVPEHVRAWLQAAAAPHVRLSPATPTRPAPDIGAPLHRATRYWDGGDGGAAPFDDVAGGGTLDPALLLERELQDELARASACGRRRGGTPDSRRDVPQRPMHADCAPAQPAQAAPYRSFRGNAGCDDGSDGGGGDLSPMSISLPLGPRRAATIDASFLGPAVQPTASSAPPQRTTASIPQARLPIVNALPAPLPTSCLPRLRLVGAAAAAAAADDASVCSHETLTASEVLAQGAASAAPVALRRDDGGGSGSSGATAVTYSSSHSGGSTALSSYAAAAGAGPPLPPLAQPSLPPSAAVVVPLAPAVHEPLPMPYSASVYQLDDTVAHPLPWGRGPQSEREAHARQALARRKEAEAQ